MAGNNSGTGAGTSVTYYRWYNGPWGSENYSKYNKSIAEQVKWDAFIYDLGYFDYGKLKVNKKNVSKLEKQEINLYKCSFIKAISYLRDNIDEYNFKIEDLIIL